MQTLNAIKEQIEKLEISFKKKIESTPPELSESMKQLWVEEKTKWHRVRFRNLYRKYTILMIKLQDNLK